MDQITWCLAHRCFDTFLLAFLPTSWLVEAKPWVPFDPSAAPPPSCLHSVKNLPEEPGVWELRSDFHLLGFVVGCESGDLLIIKGLALLIMLPVALPQALYGEWTWRRLRFTP